MTSWAEMTFREVPVGTTFGAGDYFHYKDSEITAVMEISGEQHEWNGDSPVVVEVDVVDEDWLAGVSCNPDEPEMCESCS